MKELEQWLDSEDVKDTVIMYGLHDDTYKSTNLYGDIKKKITEIKEKDEEISDCDKESDLGKSNKYARRILKALNYIESRNALLGDKRLKEILLGIDAEKERSD